jgi:hypothetical protein
MPHGRVAIITGAGQGIGAGVAKSFAAAGFSVSLMSPSDRSAKLASQLGGIGRQGSVLDPKDLAALIDETRAAYGRIDAVVNNMGHGSGTPPSTTVSTVFDPDRFPDPLDALRGLRPARRGAPLPLRPASSGSLTPREPARLAANQRGQDVHDIARGEPRGGLRVPTVHEDEARDLVRNPELPEEDLDGSALRERDPGGPSASAGRPEVGQIREEVDLHLHGGGPAGRPQAP